MCSSSPKPPPAPIVQAKPATIQTTNRAGTGSNSPTLELVAANSKGVVAGRKRRGKKAFKQPNNVSGVNTPGAAGGLSIPTSKA